MKKAITLIVGIALAVSLSACGGGESGGAQGSNAAKKTSEANATKLTLVATNYAFDQQEYRVKAGEPIEFDLTNEQGYHGYEIKDLGIVIEEGKPQQYTINEPGEYEIACNIMCGTGHADMVAKLIVE